MDEALIAQVAQGTGLSGDKVESIIKKWVMDSGKSPQELSLEDLREVLVGVLQHLFAEVVDGENPFISLSD